MNLTEEDLKKLADQLAKPDGDMGVKVGENMQLSNANMTAQAISALRIVGGDRILEIGPGNAHHVPSVFTAGEDISYTGADISELMVAEAKKNNEELVRSGQADFLITDGATLPFADQAFNKIFTVNTVYFWQDPDAYAKEIYRCLAKGGHFALTFAEKSFMEKLPFTKFGFQLYDREAASALLTNAGFTIDAILPLNERIKGNMGEFVDRDFLIVLAGRASS